MTPRCDQPAGADTFHTLWAPRGGSDTSLPHNSSCPRQTHEQAAAALSCWAACCPPPPRVLRPTPGTRHVPVCRKEPEHRRGTGSEPREPQQSVAPSCFRTMLQTPAESFPQARRERLARAPLLARSCCLVTSALPNKPRNQTKHTPWSEPQRGLTLRENCPAQNRATACEGCVTQGEFLGCECRLKTPSKSLSSYFPGGTQNHSLRLSGKAPAERNCSCWPRSQDPPAAAFDRTCHQCVPQDRPSKTCGVLYSDFFQSA